ncbi:MAG: DUF1893 domain-containing protein [Erysipelotrichaceae bacterium]|nr:DUF1893 domain-containing protein [Erysipelotrichaceae bacterium]
MNLKEILKKNNHSIVASNGYISDENGIRPVIVPMCEDIAFFKDLEVADRIIGKASAMLLCLSGVKEVYTPVLSKAGKEIFDRYGVKADYDTLAEYIVNRKGDGMCPMEMTVKDIDDLNEAFSALKKKLALQ